MNHRVEFIDNISQDTESSFISIDVSADDTNIIVIGSIQYKIKRNPDTDTNED